MGERFSAPTLSLGHFLAICQLFNDLFLPRKKGKGDAIIG